MSSILFPDFDGVTHPIGGNADGSRFGQLPLPDGTVDGFPADWHASVVFADGNTGLVEADLPRLRSHFSRSAARAR